MTIYEFDQTKHDETLRNEGRAEGRDEGEAIGEARGKLQGELQGKAEALLMFCLNTVLFLKICVRLFGRKRTWNVWMR